jgi:hypothetical protein
MNDKLAAFIEKHDLQFGLDPVVVLSHGRPLRIDGRVNEYFALCESEGIDPTSIAEAIKARSPAFKPPPVTLHALHGEEAAQVAAEMAAMPFATNSGLSLDEKTFGTASLWQMEVLPSPPIVRRISLAEGERVVLKYKPGTTCVEGDLFKDNSRIVQEVLSAIREGKPVAIPDGWELTVLSAEQAKSIAPVELADKWLSPEESPVLRHGEDLSRGLLHGRYYLILRDSEKQQWRVMKWIEPIRRFRADGREVRVEEVTALCLLSEWSDEPKRMPPSLMAMSEELLTAKQSSADPAYIKFCEDKMREGMANAHRSLGEIMSDKMAELPPRTVGVNAEATSNTGPVPVGRQPGYKATAYQRSDLFPEFRSMPLYHIRIDHVKRVADHLELETFLDDDGKCKVLSDPSGKHAFLSSDTIFEPVGYAKSTGYTAADIRELRPGWDEAKIEKHVGRPLGDLPK